MFKKCHYCRASRDTHGFNFLVCFLGNNYSLITNCFSKLNKNCTNLSLFGNTFCRHFLNIFFYLLISVLSHSHHILKWSEKWSRRNHHVNYKIFGKNSGFYSFMSRLKVPVEISCIRSYIDGEKIGLKKWKKNAVPQSWMRWSTTLSPCLLSKNNLRWNILSRNIAWCTELVSHSVAGEKSFPLFSTIGFVEKFFCVI